MGRDGNLEDFLLHENETAQWHALVNEAQARSNIHLNPELECYLVFLLIRFTNKSQLVQSVLGFEYLEQCQLKQVTGSGLQVVGDKCLLFAGLFPEHANKKRVHPNYFVQLGQCAYEGVAHIEQDTQSLFSHLSKSFVQMRDVLHASRSTNLNVFQQTTFDPNLFNSNYIDLKFIH